MTRGVFLLVDLFVGNLLFDYLIVFPQMAQNPQAASQLAHAESFVLIGRVPYSLVAGLILIGAGALIGTLGGLVWRQRVSLSILAGLIVGGLFLLVDLFVGNLLFDYLIVFPQMAQNPQAASELASSEIALLVAGLVALIGAGALIGAISALMRKRRLSL